jgi:hypothetical protein
MHQGTVFKRCIRYSRGFFPKDEADGDGPAEGAGKWEVVRQRPELVAVACEQLGVELDVLGPGWAPVAGDRYAEGKCVECGVGFGTDYPLEMLEGIVRGLLDDQDAGVSRTDDGAGAGSAAVSAAGVLLGPDGVGADADREAGAVGRGGG